MSMPFAVYHCTVCDFEDDGIRYWGFMDYQTDQGPVSVGRHPGWCVQCGGIEPVEVLPSEARIRILEARCAESEPLPAEDEDDADALATMNRSLQADWARHELEAETVRMVALRGRQQGPRCLTCGSLAVTSLPEEPVRQWGQGEVAEPVASGFLHPGCGGEILISSSKIWLNMDIAARMFDTSGREILLADPTGEAAQIVQGELFEEDSGILPPGQPTPEEADE